jgi:hypothetical protein
VILVGESADDWSAVNWVVGEVDHEWGLGFGLDRGELPECAVWSRSVEMMQIDRQDPAQVAFVDDQDLVKQLATQCSDHPFADRVPLWRSGWTENPDVVCGEDRINGCGEPGVPVSEQRLDRGDAVGEIHQEVAGGLGGSRPGRMALIPIRCPQREPCSTVISA